MAIIILLQNCNTHLPTNLTFNSRNLYTWKYTVYDNEIEQNDVFCLSCLWWKEINTNLVQTNDNIAEVYNSGKASGSNAKWKCKLEHSQ